MKKLAIFLIVFTLFCKPAQAMEPAIQFISDLADKIITNVLTSQDSEEQKINYFRKEFTSGVGFKIHRPICVGTVLESGRYRATRCVFGCLYGICHINMGGSVSYV